MTAELTWIKVADLLGKATTSAAVERIMHAPDPVAALERAVTALHDLDAAREAWDELAEAEALDAYYRAAPPYLPPPEVLDGPLTYYPGFRRHTAIPGGCDGEHTHMGCQDDID